MIFRINQKLFLILIFTQFFSINCSMMDKILYYPTKTQGNYLMSKNIVKVHEGLNKRQIEYILGTPSIKDPFETNMWYYIFRLDKKNFFIQKMLILTFNDKDILVNIENKIISERTINFY